MAPQIPDRWLSYLPIGKRIEGTRFIAFKVPLREHVSQKVEENKRLDGKLLLEKVPNLGLIIDLTNTLRYYDPGFFRKEGVEHMKLMIPGHVTPHPRLVDRFKNFVNEFIQNNSDNDKVIGVHCTHGVNRTGYLICNYMVSEMNTKPKDAIRKFGEARGHEIERKNYLDSLHQMTSAQDGAAVTSGHETNTTTLPESPGDGLRNNHFDNVRDRGRYSNRVENNNRSTERNLQRDNDNRRINRRVPSNATRTPVVPIHNWGKHSRNLDGVTTHNRCIDDPPRYQHANFTDNRRKIPHVDNNRNHASGLTFGKRTFNSRNDYHHNGGNGQREMQYRGQHPKNMYNDHRLRNDYSAVSPSKHSPYKHSPEF